MSIEEIPFTKINLTKSSKQIFNDLVKELKRRKIRFRIQGQNIYFDARFDKQVKDLLPKHY